MDQRVRRARGSVIGAACLGLVLLGANQWVRASARLDGASKQDLAAQLRACPARFDKLTPDEAGSVLTETYALLADVERDHRSDVVEELEALAANRAAARDFLLTFRVLAVLDEVADARDYLHRQLRRCSEDPILGGCAMLLIAREPTPEFLDYVRRLNASPDADAWLRYCCGATLFAEAVKQSYQHLATNEQRCTFLLPRVQGLFCGPLSGEDDPRQGQSPELHWAKRELEHLSEIDPTVVGMQMSLVGGHPGDPPLTIEQMRGRYDFLDRLSPYVSTQANAVWQAALGPRPPAR
jgi:hypothetical protein